MDREYIYVMKWPTTDEASIYKIGYTKYPSRRLTQVKREYLYDGACLFYVLLVHVPNGRQDEKFWHDNFGDKRHWNIGRYNSEWFHLSVADIREMYREYGRERGVRHVDSKTWIEVAEMYGF